MGTEAVKSDTEEDNDGPCPPPLVRIARLTPSAADQRDDALDADVCGKSKAIVPHVFQLHVKDAFPSSNPEQWGTEEPVGTGAVDWSAFFQVLHDRQINGDLVIEREAGTQRIEDVVRARELIKEYRREAN